MAAKDDLGRRGEQRAVEHLTALGWQILDRNWRCPLGELDIIADDAGTTVVVEVKTRSGLGFGHPLDAVTPRKLARLRRLAGAWCAAHPVTSAEARGDGRGAERRLLRIDVIGVLERTDPRGFGVVSLDHLRQVG
jgi:putative endonuclease